MDLEASMEKKKESLQILEVIRSDLETVCRHRRDRIVCVRERESLGSDIEQQSYVKWKKKLQT